MKKTIIILAILGLLSMTPTKRYSFSEGEAIMIFQIMEKAKQIIPQSDVISAKEANILVYSMDSIQRVIARQYNDTVKIKAK